MKFQLIITALLFSMLPSLAGFSTWTNTEGQTAELELRSVKEVEGEKVGIFGMKSGKTVHLKSSQLSDADAKRLAEWKPAAESVFEEMFEDDLVVLQDGRFQSVKQHNAPTKYYAFYYTASWCPPCQAFTPSLVKWYEKNKNENFELVLISRDQEKSAMLAYAKDKKMPWPQLKFSKIRTFEKTHAHGVNSIPTLMVCEVGGKVVGDYRHNLDALTKLVE